MLAGSHLNNVAPIQWRSKRTVEMPALGHIHQQFLSSIQYRETKGFFFDSLNFYKHSSWLLYNDCLIHLYLEAILRLELHSHK